MINKIKTNLLLIDLIYLFIITLFSIFLISFYLKAEALNTNYPDWIVHAFRVESLKDFGLSSWTHTWANGISLWKAYQFIPHLITLSVLEIFNVSASRAMVITTIGLFIFLRLQIYFVIRLLKFSPFTAFVCSMVSFDIAQYWGGVGDYSLLFGFSFFPAIVFLWTKYYEDKLQYIYPYIAGLTFYVHPILGFSSIGLWLVAVIFSTRKIISIPIIVQFLIFLASSSLFWFPVAFKSSFSYTSLVFANKYFLNLVLSGYKYYGLSLFLLLCFFLSFIRMFMPLSKEYRWTRIFFIFLSFYFILVILGLSVDLPKSIQQLQFTRGATIIGLGIIFAFATVIENLSKTNSRAIKGLVLFILSLVIIEGIWFTSEYSPSPAKSLPEPISSYLKINSNKDLSKGRVWTSDIGSSSYYAPLSYRFPYSYMGHLDSNQISPRISPLILYQPFVDSIPNSNITRINDYFKISGVQYAFFDENSPFTSTLLKKDEQIYKDLGEIKTKDSLFHLFEVPWEVKNSALIQKNYQNNLSHFPFNLELTTVNDEIALDTYVKNFVSTIYKPDNTTLAIAYPSSDSLEVKIPEKRNTDLVYIDESFDSGWKAFFNNKQVEIKPTGPNFMLVILNDLNDKGILILKHNWPISFYVSLYLIFIIPLQIGLYRILNYYLIYKPNPTEEIKINRL